MIYRNCVHLDALGTLIASLGFSWQIQLEGVDSKVLPVSVFPRVSLVLWQAKLEQ